ncbi:putative MFS multidrug transporter [Tothia fuscella]|uniref:MFS multidrug transporter n=1 Tax=Tothia fuscella TaxID=1048955 RepID=A0A9P4TVY2_9PEZI|nr:putative MFS multidrug transporter [Tothia fuscella]
MIVLSSNCATWNPRHAREATWIERLGRERPEKFRSLWEESGFVFSIVMSQVLTEYFVSGFNVVLPTVAKSLDIPRSSQTWPANAFSLVVACFLLTFGRFADMYGGFPVYVLGMAWLSVWSLIAGFSQNELMMDICRAIQGLGPSAYLPSSLMLLGSVYRPGPRMNIVFSIYGAAAPFGFYVGIFFAGLTAEFTTWRWYFFIGSILAAITAVISYFTIPSDTSERRGLGVKMDWTGAFLISAGLILVVFAITDSSHAPNGWATSYIIATLVIGVVLLAIAVYVEGWVAAMPLLPFDLFEVKYMKPLVIALLFTYGSLGVFLLYSTFYMTDIMSASPLQLVAWFSPMAVGGCIIATAGGFIMHLLPGTILILVAGVAWILAPLLFAIVPEGANYYAYVFPSMICATIAIDVTFNVTNIFISTNMPLKRQGLAGALINSILQLGIAFFLGMGDLVATRTQDLGERRSYKAVFWFEVGCASAALLLLLGFVKIKSARSDLTHDERMAMAEEERDSTSAGGDVNPSPR